MTIVGYKGSPGERQRKWIQLGILKEVVKADKDSPERRKAYTKQKELLDFCLKDYISS